MKNRCEVCKVDLPPDQRHVFREPVAMSEVTYCMEHCPRCQHPTAKPIT